MGTVGVILSRIFIFLSKVLSALQHSQSLHLARFAALHELTTLLSSTFHGSGLLLGVSRFKHLLHVRPTKHRRELGNVLIVAPTRGGKGLLATSQLLTWRHSVIVNDIKGDLYTQTAGYRSSLGKVVEEEPGEKPTITEAIIDLRTVDLIEADLSGATLCGAFLIEADLRGADLRRADLSGVEFWTNEQLARAESLVGATMPDETVMTEEAWEEFKKQYRQ